MISPTHRREHGYAWPLSEPVAVLLLCLSLLISLVPVGAIARFLPIFSKPPMASAGPTRVVSKLIGPGSSNDTVSRWDVQGADLGSMFSYHGRVYMVFGDTIGRSATFPFSFRVPALQSDWRSNTMAWTDDSDPSDGLTLAGMISDRPGHAKELLASKKQVGIEQTVIPSYGVAVGDRMYLFYESIAKFEEPGEWVTNYSGIAYSDDGGHTWHDALSVTWPGESNFAQVAVVKQGGYVYLFGIPHGRFGSAELARVPRSRVLEMDAYRYWNGRSWVADASSAAVVVPAPVGELSVRWNSYLHKWIVMYLNDEENYIALRTSDCLVGPWSAPRVVATADQYPELYGPFMTPRWNDGPDVYFTMSMFGPYSVYLMHTRLEGIPKGSGPERCISP